MIPRQVCLDDRHACRAASGGMANTHALPALTLAIRDNCGGARGRGAATVVVAAPLEEGTPPLVMQLPERHGVQCTPSPFAQAPFRIHSDARFSSVM
jgi:hypothetical protein